MVSRVRTYSWTVVDMRDIVLTASVSLDGFIAGPNGEIDWHVVDAELHQHLNRRMAVMGAFLHGRVMYELMETAWTNTDADPARGPEMVEFARIWQEMPKIVYSRTLTRADWNATIVRDVVASEVEALKAEPGGNLSLGGAQLAAAFLRSDLIDQFWIYVHPVAIGSGKSLFPPDARVTLRLVETKEFGNGVVLLRYER